jgi:hypothetical protein
LAYADGVFGDTRRPESKGQVRQGGVADGSDDVSNTDLPTTARQREHGGEIYAGTKTKRFDHCNDLADADSTRQQGGSVGQGEVEVGGGDTRDGITVLADAGQSLDRGRERRLGDVEERGGEYRGSASDGRGEWWAVEPPLGRVADGVANRVGQLRALGNGQVPEVVKLIWDMLGGRG